MTRRPDAADVELLHTAYARQPLALGLSLGVVGVFTGLLWPHFPGSGRVAWLAALLLVIGLRGLLWLAYRAHADPASRAQRWRALFIAGGCCGGVAWSFGPVALIEQAGNPGNYLLALTMVAVAAVSMSALVGELSAMWGFQAAILLPTAWTLLRTGGEFETLAALIVIAGLVTLMAVGRESHRAARRRIETDQQLARLVDEASRARERAERASLAKSRFLANMSHELRTPLAAVIGAAQLLDAAPGDAASRAQLTSAIERSGANLLALIESILDLSRIEAGELRPSERDFDLLECIESALASCALAARAKGLQIACIVDPALPAWRRGDESRLRQIVLNLLGNAVKFTAQGDVVLSAHAAPDGGVRIAVRDTGIGIAADQLGQIFEPFRQADEGSDRRFGGSGLGLAIVAQVVQVLGGRVKVDSAPGRGSCFEVELPLPEAARPPAAPLPLHARVAYIEAHEASAQALEALLLRLGCQPQRCTDAGQLHHWAAATAGSDSSWLLLDTDAGELQPWLEAAPDLDPRRIVGLAWNDSDDSRAARERLGLPRLLMKPITRTALAGRLAAIPSAEPTTRPLPLTLLTPDELAALTHVLVVEDDPLNQTIVCRLLEHAGHRASAVASGSAALAALRAGRFDVVLMDWQMPDMDGLEVTRRVRAGEAGAAARTTPIVALTANAFADDRATCLAAGMDDFLTKPIDAEQLKRTVTHWSRQAAGGDAVDPSGVAAPAAPTHHDGARGLPDQVFGSVTPR